MSKHKNRTLQNRMTRYVSWHSVEYRLARYTTGQQTLARQAVTRVRLAQYVAKPQMSDSKALYPHSLLAFDRAS